jgi:glutamyl-tRNA synthetase
MAKANLKDIGGLIEKHALANAFSHDGKAQTGAIIGKLIADNPDVKLHMKEIMLQINKTVQRVNSLGLEKQESLLRKVYPDFFKPKEIPKEKTLPPLSNAVKGKVVMRFAPSPSGPLHIGHALAMGLNSEYSKLYKGKFMLRIEDTNPENIDPKAYALIPEDANWATKNNVSSVVIQSDRIPIYYKRAEEVLKSGHAYVCFCDPEAWKELMLKGQACPDRDKPVKAQLKRWQGMLSGKVKEGVAVVRIKTDLHDKNPALRDWPALRINETPHPKTKKKYRVWPLMNFAVAVDDYELGITHSVRGKDHADNERRQNALQRKMGWPLPTGVHIGRINFTGFELSTTTTRKAIEAGKYSGWDDVRLPFLRALKRRGYTPEALIKFAIEVGPSLSDKTVSVEDFFKNLDAYNREALDKTANRYWFVPNPVEIAVEKAPKVREVSALLHPGKKATRTIKVGKKLFVMKKDLERFKDQEVRMMHLFNVKLGSKSSFTSSENKQIQKIQWISDDNIKTEVLMPSGEIMKGLGEANLKKLKVGDIIQFERFGFARLDEKKKGKLVFAFAHN